MRNVRVGRTSPAAAVLFWEDSPQACVYTHPQVLDVLAWRTEWWMAWKGEEPLCLWPVCLDEDGAVALPEFSYHVGPLWSRFGLRTPDHRRLATDIAVYDGFLESFERTYGSIRASLPVSLVDVRVFDWWNFHGPGPRCRIRPRYTARLEGLRDLEPERIFFRYRPLRRREIGRIRREGVPDRVIEQTPSRIIALYEETMARQGVNVDSSTYRAIEGLVLLVGRGHGEVLAYQYPDAPGLAYCALLLCGAGVANLVLNLVAGRYRPSGLPAWAINEAILTARHRGCDTFDFNGANSPDRGDDKHSYGSAARLYFEIKLTQGRSK